MCIVDRRFGGKYQGAIRASRPPVSIPRRRGGPLQLGPSDLSITWMESLEARDAGLPVMTFARALTLHELEIRKRNQQLKRLQLVHVDRSQFALFDFLTWTTHQKNDNWIERFDTLTDLAERVRAWLHSLTELSTPPAGSSAPSPAGPRTPSAVVFVEGRFDTILVHRIAMSLALNLRVDALPLGGRERFLAHMSGVIGRFSNRYDALVFLADADTDNESAAHELRDKIYREASKPIVRAKIFSVVAVPTTDAWVRALLRASGLDSTGPVPALRRRFELLDSLTAESVRRAADEQASLAAFVEALSESSTIVSRGLTVEEAAQALLLLAKQYIAKARERSASTHLEVTLELQTEAEITAALQLEQQKLGQVRQEGSKWLFTYTEKHPLVD